MSQLRRTRIGPFSAADAVPLDAIEKSTLGEMLLPARRALAGHPEYVASADDVELLSAGRTVETVGQSFEDGTQVAVVDADGELICVAETCGQTLAPKTVFSAR